MGSKEIKGFVLMLILSYFCVLVLSSSNLQEETLSSDSKQGKNSLIETAYRQAKNKVDGHVTIETAIKENVKIQHGIGNAKHGGGGIRPINPGESGGNSGSRTPSGTSFIPVYAAGAVNNHHPTHRGAASSHRATMSTLFAAATCSFLQLLVFGHG